MKDKHWRKKEKKGNTITITISLPKRRFANESKVKYGYSHICRDYDLQDYKLIKAGKTVLNYGTKALLEAEWMFVSKKVKENKPEKKKNNNPDKTKKLH
jgi:hypothetical protein